MTVRFAAPDGKPLIEWSARSGERSLVRALPAGQYVLAIDTSRAEGSSALLGVKGPVISRCPTEAARLTEHSADPSKGFHWPYLLYVPKEVHAPRLLIAPNNTGFATDDAAFLRASGSCDVAQRLGMVDRLGVPLLVPLFPRPMVRDVREVLAKAGTTLTARVLLTGFSASGSFVNRCALLHPEHVLAVASGSPGGWPTVPVAAVEGTALSWPVGIADVEVLTGKAQLWRS